MTKIRYKDSISSWNYHVFHHSFIRSFSFGELGFDKIVDNGYHVQEISKQLINKLVLHIIDAHVGGVNDLAFAHPNKQLGVVTCGDDKSIKKTEKKTAPL